MCTHMDISIFSFMFLSKLVLLPFRYLNFHSAI